MMINHSIIPSIALVIGLSLIPIARADLNLAAYYPFDGNANNATGNGNNGTLVGTATIQNGVVHLDGTESSWDDSFVTFGTNIDQFQTNNFSVVFGFKTQEEERLFDLAGDRVDGSNGNFLAVRFVGAGHEFIPDGTVIVELDDYGTNYVGMISSANGLNDGNWHQVAVIRNGVSLTLYLDGQLDNTVSGGDIVNLSNENDFRLGRSYWDFPNAVIQYDNLYIYNRAISECEIMSLYTGTGQGECDSDNDGIKNSLDNCPSISNSDQLDTDEDGAGDVCDYDDDNDGIENSLDNCPSISNSDQLDTDEDGTGDACDDDDDNDGVEDMSDNCLLTSNSDQLDADGDGAGNACDTDDDGDGVIDSNDQCLQTALGEIVDPITGCSINDLCPCMHPPYNQDKWRNHGAYVSSVAHTSKDFVEAGLITADERDLIMAEASQSPCGKK
ncbi:hypothetical protein THII_2498 [Thioploca ingrica]|uniref:Laminin G domain-containing protein n=1 Tax=Thioploca ingrica TaxID=40754 RepID=A0A090AN92_9GAMM|nr:hypothetical protein THII_2498 [Thioploca ingrica]